jgi:hypothetical protein
MVTLHFALNFLPCDITPRRCLCKMLVYHTGAGKAHNVPPPTDCLNCIREKSGVLEKRCMCVGGGDDDADSCEPLLCCGFDAEFIFAKAHKVELGLEGQANTMQASAGSRNCSENDVTGALTVRSAASVIAHMADGVKRGWVRVAWLGFFGLMLMHVAMVELSAAAVRRNWVIRFLGRVVSFELSLRLFLAFENI